MNRFFNIVDNMLGHKEYPKKVIGEVAEIVDKNNDNISFIMPAQDDCIHEGTWLQWPHNYGWDKRHKQRYENSWVAMVKALYEHECVHIIVYNETELQHVKKLLSSLSLSEDDNMMLSKKRIDYYIFPTDDVWIRDNGPNFVFDTSNHQLYINNWEFNGWGNKSYWELDNQIPTCISKAIQIPVTNNIPMILEGGSFEVDGNGTFMAKESSILNPNRNKNWTKIDAEKYFTKYLGVTNFIWLKGKCSKGDITDDHIDGTARFANSTTNTTGPTTISIVTMHRKDFLVHNDYDILKQATNIHGDSYHIIHLPITKYKVRGVGDYGIYVNYYVANGVVLIPKYNDPNDNIAATILQDVYKTRKVIPIDFIEIYKDGGVINCVTQQQPKAAFFNNNKTHKKNKK